MGSKSEVALAKFAEGYSCSQAVFYSFCDELHFDKNTALKLACGFGGGMARKGEVCGAVTGGILVIGAKHGMGEKDDQAARELTYEKTRQLMDRFAEEHGTCICRTLLNGCDLGTEEGKKQFEEKDMRNSICQPCIRSAVGIIEEIMS